MCCKHVLESIRTRPEEEENKEEVIFLCWRSFLFRDINAAKNKRNLFVQMCFSLELGKRKRGDAGGENTEKQM